MVDLVLLRGDGQPTVVAGLVKMLERLLAEAKRGEIVGIAAVTVGPRGETWSQFDFDLRKHFHQVYYEIATLQAEVDGAK